MIATFLILLPVFGLIVAGYACRMLGVLGPTSATELNKFVVWLALPALLFDIMAHTPWHHHLSTGILLGVCPLLRRLICYRLCLPKIPKANPLPMPASMALPPPIPTHRLSGFSAVVTDFW
ncbi:hypothetical protein LZ023_39510 (plasmid) [Pseudomonas silvicola]|nr:hypothetical protein LZ023_39510 [Pseudomonas silvicola]